MYNKAILENGGTLEFVHERWKTQEMCNGVVFKDTLLLISCPKIHKSLKMCDEVAQWSESIV